MLSEFIAATSDQQPSEIGIDLSALSKSTIATLSQLTTFGHHFDEAMAVEGENDIGFRTAKEFGDMIESGNILSSVHDDCQAARAWWQVWNSSTKNFQLHFHHEDATPFYFDFTDNILYLCIAPRSTYANQEDSKFDREGYLAAFKAGEIEFKRDLININGVCVETSGTPECIII